MTMKKILAGVLAAVSMLSVSATAFADAPATTTFDATSQPPANGVSYDVGVDVTYGKVDCVLPAATVLAKNSVFVNPYGAAITTTIGGDKIKNINFIASDVYTITNNDTENGLKVIATVSVKKATGLVIVDGNAKAPEGWATAVDKNGDSVRVDEKDDEGTALNDFGTVFNPLVSYDKIALTYKKGEAKTPENLEKAVGGAVSTKQAMNTAVYLSGGTTAADVVKGKTETNNKIIPFAAKGTTGGTLLEIDNKGGTANVGYFTTCGELNPAIDKENYSWGKENLSLSIVLKLVPTVVAP